MKLLVVVETLNGSRIAWSIASTLSAPEPMPSSPDSAARAEHHAEAGRHAMHVVCCAGRRSGG